jgi:hypothetical protein
MRLPDLQNIETAKQLYQELDSWKRANRVISAYFQSYPGNTDEQIVVIKVALINDLYFTNIKEPLKMATHILKLHGLDGQLAGGKVEAVESIAKVDDERTSKGYRYYSSFASKYAHFHNKTAFPILDRFVKDAIAHLWEKKLPNDYKGFFEMIQEFRQKAKLTSVSWEDLDKYLWLYGQKAALDKGKREINKEVRELYNKESALFEALEPKGGNLESDDKS